MNKDQNILNIIMSGLWLGLGIVNLLIEFNIINGEPVSNFLYALACFTCAILFL